MNILGLSPFETDASACLVQDGRLAAAAREAWFTRRNRDSGFPRAAAAFCLERAGLAVSAVDCVVIGHKPLPELHEELLSLLDGWPRQRGRFRDVMDRWLGQKLHIASALRDELGYEGEIAYCRRHEAHGGGAFYLSPFASAAVVVFDRQAPRPTVSIGRGEGGSFHLLEQAELPEELQTPAAAGPAARNLLSRIVRRARHAAQSSALCLAGSPDLARTTHALLAEAGDGDVFLSPLADGGGEVIGAALTWWHGVLGNRRDPPYARERPSGPCVTPEAIERYLSRAGIKHRRLPDAELIRTVAQLLGEGKTVGWFQGELQYLSPAPGCRSVLARPETAQKRWDGFFSPYALIGADATTEEPLFARLLKECASSWGLPALAHAPLKAADSPVACTPQNAYQCFRWTRACMDALVLGRCLL